MADISKYNDFDDDFILHEMQYPMQQKEDNALIQVSKELANVMDTTIRAIPDIFKSQIESNRAYLQDILGTIKALESYGIITINKPQERVESKQEEKGSFLEFLGGLGVLGAIAVLFRIGIMLF